MTTDDFQVQQKSNAVPYGLLGAGAGAGIGAATAKWGNFGIKTKPDLEKVFAQEPDEFKRQIEKGGENKGAWETAQTWAQKIKESDKKFEEYEAEVKASSKSVEAQIGDDVKEKKELKTAQENYDKEVKKLMEEKKVTKGGSGEFKPKAYDPATMDKLLTTAEKTEYEADFANYETKKTAMEAHSTYQFLNEEINGRPAAHPSGAADGRKKTIENAFEEMYNDAKSSINKKVERYKNIDAYMNRNKFEDSLRRAVTDKDFSRALTDEKIISLAGGESKIVYGTAPAPITSTVAGATVTEHEVIPVIDKKGKQGWVQLKTKTYVPATTTGTTPTYLTDQKYAEALDSARDDLRTKFKANFKKYFEAKEKLEKLPETFKPDKGLVKAAGLVKNDKGGVEDLATHMADFESKAAEFKQDMETLKKAGVHNSDKQITEALLKHKDVSVADIEAILSKYDAGTTAQTYSSLDAKLKLLDSYNAEKKALEKQIESAKKAADPVLTSLESRMAKFKENVKEGKEFAAAESRMKARWAKKLGFTEGKTETVSGLTEEAAKKKLEGSEVAKRLKEKQEALEKYAKEHKIEAKELSGEELAKALKEKCGAASKEEYSKTVREQAAKEVEPLLKQLKKVHVGWTAAAAAGILGVAGLVAGMSGKSEA